jgi:hypothetical protein
MTTQVFGRFYKSNHILCVTKSGNLSYTPKFNNPCFVDNLGPANSFQLWEWAN